MTEIVLSLLVGFIAGLIAYPVFSRRSKSYNVDTASLMFRIANRERRRGL